MSNRCLSAHFPPLKVLPAELPVPPWPVGIMTLKNRTISPAAQLLLECAHDTTTLLSRCSTAINLHPGWQARGARAWAARPTPGE